MNKLSELINKNLPLNKLDKKTSNFYLEEVNKKKLEKLYRE